MGDVRHGRGDVKEGCRIPSQFIFIPAVSLLRAPLVQHYRGETEGHNRRREGKEEGGGRENRPLFSSQGIRGLN